MRYVLVTPARNEEAYIEKLLSSVANQKLKPVRWVIVDDASTDRTAEIVRGYALQHPWIELVQRSKDADRSFAAKVRAFNAGFERVRDLSYDVIGNLDADISFDPDYMAFIMEKFEKNSKLGVAGTPFTQDDGYDSAKDSFEGDHYVAGGCQLFRSQCFEEIGGYKPNRGGGIDWIAVMTARMKGWEVQSFSEKRWHHYRTLGTAQRSGLGALYDYGERAYFLGSSPIWHFFRVLYRMAKRPFVVGGIMLMVGYVSAGLRRIKRPVSPELMRFYRGEQMKKLRAIFSNLLRLKRVDSFHLEAGHQQAR